MPDIWCYRVKEVPWDSPNGHIRRYGVQYWEVLERGADRSDALYGHDIAHAKQRARRLFTRLNCQVDILVRPFTGGPGGWPWCEQMVGHLPYSIRHVD